MLCTWQVGAAREESQCLLHVVWCAREPGWVQGCGLLTVRQQAGCILDRRWVDCCVGHPVACMGSCTRVGYRVCRCGGQQGTRRSGAWHCRVCRHNAFPPVFCSSRACRDASKAFQYAAARCCSRRSGHTVLLSCSQLVRAQEGYVPVATCPTQCSELSLQGDVKPVETCEIGVHAITWAHSGVCQPHTSGMFWQGRHV